MEATINTKPGTDQLLAALRTYWGYDSFRPLQEEAMLCALSGRDSLVVLPTGGGKSLCFQAPAVCHPGLAVVVSPLISLMKDQIDALRSCGVPAACINSSLSAAERGDVARQVRDGGLKLLYMAPERLVQPRSLEFLAGAGVSLVAIDEAHCISNWGHDFRPEYRQLRVLKEVLPNVGIHAYTATATERVRRDIAQQLGLANPKVLVGSFDRPNLHFRAHRQNGLTNQIREVLARHVGESGIIYCTSRARTEELSAELNDLGMRTLPYHAGLSDEQRHRHQDAFIEDEIETIVATVAFGMGIDKPNVRYVIHAGLPKSLEHYQQESGRAGRDGLEAECCLFYSGGDFAFWKRLIAEGAPEAQAGSLAALSAVYNYATSVVCRHRALVEHFGQTAPERCAGACDVCQGGIDLVDDALIVGQKILSSVLRQNQRFGAHYTAQVLAGSKEERIRANGHEQLSTFGLLADAGISTIRDWIEQLIGQNYLVRAGEHDILQVTDAGRRLLRGEETPRLLKPVAKPKSKGDSKSNWEGVDRGLFDELRHLRTDQARAAHVPAYIIFGDAALRDMARRRPSTLASFLNVKGVGRKKCDDYGETFVARITSYCRERDLPQDQ